MATAANTQSIITSIDQALNAANTFLPSFLSFLGMFYAPANALVPFLPLIQTALNGVEIVEQNMGLATAQATQTVIDHLTPGAPNATALNGPATPLTPAN